MAATATILDLETRSTFGYQDRFARVLLADAGVQRVMGVGGIPTAGDAQAYLDARADSLFARAATEGTVYNAAMATADIDDAKRLYDAIDQIARLERAIVALCRQEFNKRPITVVAEVGGTFDPANLADAAGLTQTFTATGAAFGDYVLLAAPYSLQGITATAYVSAANQIAVRLQNESGGAINLASGTWTAIVLRLLSPITAAEARNAVRNHLDAGA